MILLHSFITNIRVAKPWFYGYCDVCDQEEDCEKAYFKMDNVLIDDRRIHVDFSQSVSKIKWKGKGEYVHPSRHIYTFKFLSDDEMSCDFKLLKCSSLQSVMYNPM